MDIFGSDPGFVSRITSRPGFVNLVQSGPGFDNPVRSDPIRSGPIMYFVMFWYVTEVCRNVFIRLC